MVAINRRARPLELLDAAHCPAGEEPRDPKREVAFTWGQWGAFFVLDALAIWALIWVVARLAAWLAGG